MVGRRKKRKWQMEDEERETTVFLPGCLEQVRAIAMRGASDTEIARTFGISKDLIEAWKEFYPDFAKTIEEGRTEADQKVVKKLFELTQGYSHVETKVHFDSEGNVTEHDIIRHHKPEMRAIEYWLNNRQKEHWNSATHMQVTGKKDEPAIGVRNESKEELMSSILSLIKPKEDG